MLDRPTRSGSCSVPNILIDQYFKKIARTLKAILIKLKLQKIISKKYLAYHLHNCHNAFYKTFPQTRSSAKHGVVG